MTLDEAVELVGDQYHGRKRYTGQILARMVKRGLIERVRRGVYARKRTAREKLKDPVWVESATAEEIAETRAQMAREPRYWADVDLIKVGGAE